MTTISDCRISEVSLNICICFENNEREIEFILSRAEIPTFWILKSKREREIITCFELAEIIQQVFSISICEIEAISVRNLTIHRTETNTVEDYIRILVNDLIFDVLDN